MPFRSPDHLCPGGLNPNSAASLITIQDQNKPKEKHNALLATLYHLVWSTKNRHPLLTPNVEPIIYNFLRTKAIGLGATVFALNGTEDHVHVVISIPPKIAVATFIGQIKAVASTKFNKSEIDHPSFFWQNEYGAFSFDAKRLPNYIAYVERQKEHHAQGAIISILERTTDSSPKIIQEATMSYAIEDNDWRRELEILSG